MIYKSERQKNTVLPLKGNEKCNNNIRSICNIETHILSHLIVIDSKRKQNKKNRKW